MARRSIYIRTSVAASPIKNITATITASLCGSADSTNWPVLVSISDATIKDVAHGGYVLNTSTTTRNGVVCPNDLVLYSDAAHTTPLSFEFWQYDGTNGIALIWVKVPTVSHSVDTPIYIQCGDVLVVTYQGGTAGAAWNSNFMAVYPLYESTNPYIDHSANANSSTSGTYPTQVTGKIYKGQLFDGTTQYMTIPHSATLNAATNFTLNAWINHTANNTAYETIASKRGAGGSPNYEIGLDTAVHTLYLWGGAGYIPSTTALTLGTWQMITVLGSSTTGSTFLLNAAGSNTTIINLGATNSVALNIGDSSGSVAGQYFNGSLEFLTLSSVQWSTSNIVTTYNNTNAPGNIGAANFISYSSWT